MATPKSFGVGGGNGHSSRQPIQGIPRREMQEELRGIMDEAAPQAQLDPRSQPPQPAQQNQEPPVRRAGPQRRIIKMPPSQPKPAPEANGNTASAEVPAREVPAPDTTARAPEPTASADGPLEFVVSFTRDEIPTSLERTLRFLEDRDLTEIVDRVTRAYFADRLSDPQVKSAMEAWEQYGPVAE